MARSLTGTRIRERRKSLKISQIDLAKRANISPSYLNLIEHNRRGIAGKTLNALAAALQLDPTQLSEGVDQTLLDQLSVAATQTPTNAAEIDQMEEFIGRYPGWANLIANLADTNQRQRQDLLALSDRLNNDPYFSEAIHMMLSNITAIQSTAGILAEGASIPSEARTRFLNNLSTESNRLSRTSSDLLRYFDEPTQRDDTADLDAVDLFWQENDFHLPDLEVGRDPAIVAESFKNKQDRNRALREMTQYARLAAKLPLETFIEQAIKNNFDAVRLSTHFDVAIDEVLQRFAHLPKSDDLPLFGMIKVDNAGGILFRKTLPRLSLPQYSSACPLWPVYRALGQPSQPIRAFFEMPTGETFYSLAYALAQSNSGYGLPATHNSIMIFTEDYQNFLTRPQQAMVAQLKVGLHCSVCPRRNCGSRRQSYLLA